MDVKKSRSLRYFVLILILATGLYWYAPNPWEDHLCYDIPQYYTGQFVTSVWPPPNSEMGLSCYRVLAKGVRLSVGGLVADVYPPPEGSIYNIPLANRTRVYIDGIPQIITFVTNPATKAFYINELGDEVYVDDGSFIVSLFPFIGRGKHMIVVKTINNIGQKLEYQWSFTIK